jgi:ribosome-binding factor A
VRRAHPQQMPREFSRTDRLGDQIQRELAQLLEFEVGDPRLRAATITGVRLSRDLSHARVYVSVLGDAAEVEETLAALKRAAGFFRSQLARRIIARTTPALHFHYDDSVSRGQRVSALIDSALGKDRGEAPDSEQDPSDSDPTR